LNKDPDNVAFQKGWRNIQKLEKLKAEGTYAFSNSLYQEAVEKFTECLEMDPLNNAYNSTILFNRSSAYVKLGHKQNALADLNKAIEINDSYVKALLKRSELHLAMEDFE
jgi:tetratricopeptide (TPR) repeat protein